MPKIFEAAHLAAISAIILKNMSLIEFRKLLIEFKPFPPNMSVNKLVQESCTPSRTRSHSSRIVSTVSVTSSTFFLYLTADLSTSTKIYFNFARTSSKEVPATSPISL